MINQIKNDDRKIIKRNLHPRGIESSTHLKASHITQNELNNAVFDSPVDCSKFEVHRVRYHHPADPERYESTGQDKEPYYRIQLHTRRYQDESIKQTKTIQGASGAADAF